MSEETKRCKKCNGSGRVGECVNLPFGGQILTVYECPRCKGKRYVERKAKKTRRKCESCKHSRWFGEYAMTICEKHGKTNMLEVCVDYEEKAKDINVPTNKKGGEK